MAKHNIPFVIIKQIPMALTDSIMIFKSVIYGGDLLMMLSLKDSSNNGYTINVPIALELKYSSGYEANIATTVFGRRKKSGLPDDRWFINQANDGNLIYKNTKKAVIGRALPRCYSLGRTHVQNTAKAKYSPRKTLST